MKEGDSYSNLSRIQRPFNLWESSHPFSLEELTGSVVRLWMALLPSDHPLLIRVADGKLSSFCFKFCSRVCGHFLVEKANVQICSLLTVIA